jgi:hypothetical protein
VYVADRHRRDRDWNGDDEDRARKKVDVTFVETQS